MVCEKCGVEIEEQVKTCPNCGAELLTVGAAEVTIEEEITVMDEQAVPADVEETVYEQAEEEVLVQENPVVTPVEAPKKSLVKKWWFWAIIGVVVVALIIAIAGGGSGSSGSSGGSGSSYIPMESPYVSLVKTTVNSNYGISYGSAFNAFFSSPSWEYFKASSGEDVVEFEGIFSYDGNPAVATIQFVLDLDEGMLEVYHLSINDVAQSKLMLSALLEVVFESY